MSCLCAFHFWTITEIRQRFLLRFFGWLLFYLVKSLFYFIQLGFLDGKAGYIYGRLLSQYEYQIGVKLYELRNFGGHLNPDNEPQESSTPKSVAKRDSVSSSS